MKNERKTASSSDSQPTKCCLDRAAKRIGLKLLWWVIVQVGVLAEKGKEEEDEEDSSLTSARPHAMSREGRGGGRGRMGGGGENTHVSASRIYTSIAEEKREEEGKRRQGRRERLCGSFSLTRLPPQWILSRVSSPTWLVTIRAISVLFLRAKTRFLALTEIYVVLVFAQCQSLHITVVDQETLWRSCVFTWLHDYVFAYLHLHYTIWAILGNLLALAE